MAITRKSPEKRQYPRQDVILDAVLSVGDLSAIQCQITDFSEKGMFLKFKIPSTVSLQKNKIARLYFSAKTGTTKEYFQIDAEIARVVAEGVGISFDNLSDSMFRALLQTASEGGAISGFSKNPKFTLSTWGQDRFLSAFNALLNKFLPAIIDDFFDSAEDELEKPPQFAENFKDVVALGNMKSVLRMNKQALTKKYFAAITSDVDFTSDKYDQKITSHETNPNLSLIEKDEFETLLNFSSVVRKINAQFKNQLYQLELKLSYVTCFPRFLIKNPIDPERLCDCFRKEIASVESSSAVQRTLYKAFQITLSKKLGTLYQAFDDLLVEYGAPPEIAQDIVWKKNYPGSSPSRKKEKNFTEYDPGQQPPSFDSDAYYYEDPSSRPYSYESPVRQRQYQQPLTETATKLINLINKSLPDAASIPSLLNPQAQPQEKAGDESEFSIDELLSALTKLQVSNVAQQLSKNSSSLLQSQLDQAMQSAAFLGEKHFSTADKTKLEVYDQLYQALSNEVALSPGIKPYVENIKLPLMGLALQDPNFLDSETHPARNLLNQLVNLESAVNQNKIIKNTKIRQMLDQLIANISQNSINNPDIFAKANEELKEISGPIVKSRELNIRRVVEIQEGKQKLEKARHKIQTEIDQRIAGKTIPSIILSLLESGWQHLLVIAELEGNFAGKERYLETLDALLMWYTDLEKLPKEQAGIIKEELNFINTALETVCTNAFVLSKVMEELNDTLLASDAPRSPKPVEMVHVEKKAKTTGGRSKIDMWHLQVDQFQIGDWFTFSMEKEAFEPLKLVWIGERPLIYVFVNRDGYKRQELTRDQLADYLQIGVATKIENLDEPLMDRATTGMLQKMQEKLIHSVSHDPVTNLPNRRRFMSLIKEELSGAKNPNPVLGILEIEDFRIITNVCGVVGGDQLLLQTAKAIGMHLGNDGIAARMGDKTFGIFIRDGADDAGFTIAKNLRDLINKSSFVWDDKSYTISVSIGLVAVKEGFFNVEELLQNADSVNISAQRTGHNRIRVYQENDETLRIQANIHEWAGRIDRIFAENRLFPRCQMIAPIFPEKNNHSHYEILLGVRDEEGKIIPPDNFIPAVEQCQRMPEIDRWIIENVFRWITDNPSSFAKIGGFAINLSGQSLNSEDFLSFLKERLAVNDIPAKKITFEVTETVAAGSLVFTKRFIKEIKHFGCSFSLDDFGTGYSSYSYLKSLDVDYLKIDGSFIKDIANSPTDQVMVNSMNEIAHSLDMETIAEYVENMKIQAVLKEIGVDYAQGWGIHKPIPLAELNATLLN